MKVFYGKPNTLTLPYAIDGKPGTFTFVPGKNEINAEVWKAIVIQHKAKFEAAYSQYLKVFQPVKTEQVPVEFGKNDVPVAVELGEEAVDFSSLSVQAAIELAKNTMDPDELREYLSAEKTRKGQRKAVINAIKDQLEEIEQFDRTRREGQEK